jgi:hypothetical protein
VREFREGPYLRAVAIFKQVDPAALGGLEQVLQGRNEGIPHLRACEQYTGTMRQPLFITEAPRDSHFKARSLAQFHLELRIALGEFRGAAVYLVLQRVVRLHQGALCALTLAHVVQQEPVLGRQRAHGLIAVEHGKVERHREQEAAGYQHEILEHLLLRMAFCEKRDALQRFHIVEHVAELKHDEQHDAGGKEQAHRTEAIDPGKHMARCHAQHEE